MSRARLGVLYPDGRVKFGMFDGTIDRVALGGLLYDTPTEAFEAWTANAEGSLTVAYPGEDDSGSPVEVYVDYGHGWTFAATADDVRLTSGLSFVGPPTDRDSAPAWFTEAAQRA